MAEPAESDVAVRGRGGWARTVPTDEGHRVTTFELFFDLVYVFAATRITGYMAHEHSAHGVVQGLLLLALLWWTWSAYTWLGNQARADEGLLRAGMGTAMAAIFVVALTVPEAWHDMAGGLYGPVVLVCAYLVVRVIHLVVYSAAATAVHDAGLRRQVAVAWPPLLLSAALLIAGALLGGRTQTLLFAAALAVDWGIVYLTSRGGDWRVHSAGHWSERYGLFMILAIGESIAAIGVGAAQHPISTQLLIGAAIGIAIAIGLWWLYFDILSLEAEHRLARLRGRPRARLAMSAYSYGHYVIVAGIVLTALGIEGVLEHSEDGKGLGGFYGTALCGGTALYLAGLLAFKSLTGIGLSVPRLVAVLVLLALIPAAAALPPLAGLGCVALVLTALIVVEGVRYADVRRDLRGA
ncbi:low temperature requirement protein A [Streptomyces sp. B93]|uniref:low temperature requirement protein A n=1 Tax=Streptomyces sp. B93 TaxID=2824875 RepID=UPI001B3600C5|nr:low temperature requirement protein A [Streptomyces sp. B93]MBQ1092693.1 low temperature requirement protein A [Streptomyces sp. B93]